MAVLVLAGCTPVDPLVGSYNFTMTGTDTTTAPSNSTSTPTGTGTLAVTHGVATDYLIVIGQTDANGCTLKGDKTKDKPLVVTVQTGQTCSFNYSTGKVTATLTQGDQPRFGRADHGDVRHFVFVRGRACSASATRARASARTRGLGSDPEVQLV